MRDRRAWRQATWRIGALAAVALLPACSLVTTMTSTPGPHPTQHPLPVAGTPLFDWKGIVHCHSHLSHDSDGTIAEIAAACRAAGDDFVFMTDHQTDESIRDGQRGFADGVLFVVGCEARSPQGSVIAFPLQQPLRRWQHAGLLAKDAIAQGGVAFVCHAEGWSDWDVPEMTGVEIVNLHAAAKTRGYTGTILTALFLPLRFLFERLSWRDPGVFRHWDERLAVRHPCTPVGGNDAHANVDPLGPFGPTIGTYEEVFLTLSTHILAAQLTQDALVEGLRLGRTYVSFDIFGEGAGFDFRATDGAAVHVVGATVARTPGLRLQVKVPQQGSIEFWRDGARVRAVFGDAAAIDDPEPGIWRVEVRTRHGSPWIFSSSIAVTAPAARGRATP